MKKRLPAFATGMLTMALIGALTVSALAATGGVSFNASNLMFNGAQISAKGEDYALANGCMAPSSITYTDEKGGGTTYLPVRRISELLGVETGWDGATGSVTVGNAPESLPPVDPNHVPEITVDELKALFKFDLTYELNGKDIYYFKYCGELSGDSLLRWWSALNEDDVNAALTTWVVDFYNTEYKGSKEIRLAIYARIGGTSCDFSGIRYLPSKGVNDFYFNRWER